MSHIDPSSVRLVDGFKIRHTLDPDFAIMHCHSTAINQYYMPKYYIPEGEWWLDHNLKDELKFFIKLESITRAKNIKNGLSFREYLKKRLLKKGPIPNFIIKKEWHFSYRLVIVDGSIIRRYIDPEFTQGGHDLVYDYVPKGEIWIEKAVQPKEIPFILRHEMIERKMMSQGKNYDTAHEYATAVEKDMRRQHGGFYPLDEKYQWSKLTDEEIKKKYYAQ